jgi:hypothetical protein
VRASEVDRAVRLALDVGPDSRRAFVSAACVLLEPFRCPQSSRLAPGVCGLRTFAVGFDSVPTARTVFPRSPLPTAGTPLAGPNALRASSLRCADLSPLTFVPELALHVEIPGWPSMLCAQPSPRCRIVGLLPAFLHRACTRPWSAFRTLLRSRTSAGLASGVACLFRLPDALLRHGLRLAEPRHRTRPRLSVRFGPTPYAHVPLQRCPWNSRCLRPSPPAPGSSGCPPASAGPAFAFAASAAPLTFGLPPIPASAGANAVQEPYAPCAGGLIFIRPQAQEARLRTELRPSPFAYPPEIPGSRV